MASRSLTYLDTHVAVWLHEGRPELLTPGARSAVEQGELRISPMVVLEIELLREIGRTTGGAAEVLGSLGPQLGLVVCDLDFRQAVDAAVGCGWTRDPFDRIIIGHARAAGGSLITRDERIRQNAPEAIW